MNTKEYYRPEMKVLFSLLRDGFATIPSGYDHKMEDYGNLESPEFEEW